MAGGSALPDISNESIPSRMLFTTIRKTFPTAQQLSTSTLYSWLEDPDIAPNILLLDVRETNEYSISKIDNSIHVLPNENDLSFIKTKIKADNIQKVIAYCSLGYRSSKLAAMLQNQIKEDMPSVEIYNLEGSIFKWANEGKQVVDKSGAPVNQVHPYNIVWGKFLNSDLHKWP